MGIATYLRTELDLHYCKQLATPYAFFFAARIFSHLARTERQPRTLFLPTHIVNLRRPGHGLLDFVSGHRKFAG